MAVFIFSISLTFIPVGSASISGTWANEVSDYWNYEFKDEHASDSALFSAYAQNFTASTTGYISSLRLRLKLSGSPTAFLEAVIIDSSDLNANGVPDEIWGSPIATSEMFYSGTLTSSYQNIIFSFDGSVQVTSGQVYAIVVRIISANVDASNYVCVSANSGSYSGGNVFKYSTVGWEVEGNMDLIGTLFVSSEPLTTPTPTPVVTATPTPSPTPEAMPNWISDIIDAFIPIFAPLLVIFFCGALGWRFAGAWGFFAGINLAIVLLYVIVPTYMPLWAIVAVIVVDIGLLFGKVGFDRR